MIVRKIREDEAKKAVELFNIAFEFQMDDKKNNEEIIKDMEGNLSDRPSLYWRERWAAFEDDDKTMMGCMQVIPYQIRFDGHVVMMGGIGGVATYPPYRRQGAIRECFRLCLDDMYQKGHVFSLLYPFSRAYYRKFGYENGIEATQWTINFKGVKPFQTEGSAYLYRAGEDISDFKAIYDGFSENYNFMVVREKEDFEYIKKVNAFKDKKYAYVWKNKDGIPKAYMIFNKERVGERIIMDCTRYYKPNDFCFSDDEGFRGLMDLALTFSADYQAIRFRLPSQMRLGALISEGNELAREVSYVGMLRVINVEKALQLAEYKGSGQLSIRIHDIYCPWNDGVWHLAFTDGKSTGVSRDNAETYDMELDIATFSTLLGGCRDKSDFPYFKDIKIIHDSEHIEKVFYMKNSFHCDFY